MCSKHADQATQTETETAMRGNDWAAGMEWGAVWVLNIVYIYIKYSVYIYTIIYIYVSPCDQL